MIRHVSLFSQVLSLTRSESFCTLHLEFEAEKHSNDSKAVKESYAILVFRPVCGGRRWGRTPNP